MTCQYILSDIFVFIFRIGDAVFVLNPYIYIYVLTGENIYAEFHSLSKKLSPGTVLYTHYYRPLNWERDCV